MHYCCLVFTRQEPEYGVVEDALMPFDERGYYAADEAERDPKIPFLYDFYGIGGGGRFLGVIAMEDETEEESKAAGRVSASLREPLDAEYILGRSFCYVAPDGKGRARSRFDYAKQRWVTDPQYEKRGLKIFETEKECFVTVVDIHD